MSNSKASIGEYQLVAELARGGMGRVYLARRSGRRGFERFFAIKVMHHQLAEDQDAILMLLDEAHIASRVHHPNVVPVIDMGNYERGYYLVMDYVEGCSLHELLRRDRQNRPPRLIVPVILETLNGLHAVHTLKNEEGVGYGIVHRDVSPHNLLLGIDGSCRVIDFGIAKATARFSETQAGMYKGKLPYMAPEQLTSEDADCRADVWSAGVTLYEALTATHPCRGANDAGTLQKILNEPIAPPSTVGLRPPACLDAVIMKALNRNVAERYQTAQQMAEALRKVALANDMLGAPSEVATWVESACGDDLSERRHRIKLVHDADVGHGTGHTPNSMPRLWGDTRPAFKSVEVDITKLDEPLHKSTRPPAPRVPKVVWMAGTALVVALGCAAAFYEIGRAANQEPATRQTNVPDDPLEDLAASSPPPAAAVAPEIAAPVAAPIAAAVQEPVAEAAPVRVRRPFARRTRPAAQPAAAQQAPVAQAEPPAAPQPVRRSIDRNPYLRGE